MLAPNLMHAIAQTNKKALTECKPHLKLTILQFWRVSLTVQDFVLFTFDFSTPKIHQLQLR